MLIGKLSFSIWTAPYDFSLIDTKRMDARLKPSTSIKNEFSQRYPVSCGYVEAFNGAFINELGELYTGVTITNMLSDSGDSGSPAFSFSDL
ncbi:4709_t:CDS:2, partial [Gigaspora rosea]